MILKYLYIIIRVTGAKVVHNTIGCIAGDSKIGAGRMENWWTKRQRSIGNGVRMIILYVMYTYYSNIMYHGLDFNCSESVNGILFCPVLISFPLYNVDGCQIFQRPVYRGSLNVMEVNIFSPCPEEYTVVSSNRGRLHCRHLCK